MLLDIRPDHLQIVQKILQRHVPQYAVWAFGSRAKWTARDYSDLDLCIVSDKALDFSLLGVLAEAFSESDLPYKVDVVDWATTSESFRKIIEQDKVVIQKGQQSQISGTNPLAADADVGLRGANPTYAIFTELLSTIVDNRGKTCPVGNTGIPLIATNCVDRSNLYPSYDTTRFVSEDTYKNWFRGHPLPGDILFVCKGSPGRTNWVPDPVDFCIAQDMVAVRANPKKIYPKYLFAVLRSSIVQDQIDSLHVGTMIPHFKKGDFDKLKIPMVSEESQKIIGDFYFTLSERIALLRETNTTLEAIAQALFKSWFVDFDPVYAKQACRERSRTEGMDAETAVLFPDSFEESELGLVPSGWQMGILANLATLNPESWTVKKHPSTVAYIDLANAKNNEIAAITNYPFDDAPSRARRVLRKGDTIVGTVRPGNRSFAFIHQAASNLTASTGFAVLRPSIIQNTEFIYLAATQDLSIEHLAHVADGGAYPAVRPEVVAGIQCVLPSDEVMQSFHNVTASLLASIAENQHQAQTLATLRDTLLPRLISGQLRLPEAKTLLEDTIA